MKKNAQLSNERKKIMFYDTPDRQVRFRIRCQHDGISQSQFFRFMLGGYIDDNPLIQQFLKSCKEKHNLQGKNKISKAERISKAVAETKKKFSLEENEIQSIYDIIELEGEI